MTDKEIIESYILKNYTFTSDSSGWRIFDNLGECVLTLKVLIRYMERVFPNMNTIKIVSDWFQLNITTVTDKIRTHLCKYKLVLGGRRLAWDIINGFGKSLDKNELYELYPQHHKTVIDYVYDQWFREMSEIETRKEIGC